MFPSLDGVARSPRRDLAAQVRFLESRSKKTAFEPWRGPIRGVGVYRAGGKGASAPIFVILSIHLLATSNSDEPKKMTLPHNRMPIFPFAS